MRNLRNPQLERGEVRIEDIELDIKCRDDIPALLIGLQYLYSQEALRDRLFALMDGCILPGDNRKVGRPGMAMWSILIMSVVKQGLGCDFDRLHELANQHMAIRRFLGHADIGDKKHYHYQTLVDPHCPSNLPILTSNLKKNHVKSMYCMDIERSLLFTQWVQVWVGVIGGERFPIIASNIFKNMQLSIILSPFVASVNIEKYFQ